MCQSQDRSECVRNVILRSFYWIDGLPLGVPFLGSVPLDPSLARCSDLGVSIFEEQPESSTVLVYKDIVSKITRAVESGAHSDSMDTAS